MGAECSANILFVPCKVLFAAFLLIISTLKSVFLLNKSKLLFRIGKIRLFELTSSAGQWMRIWVVHANRECCHQWGASYVRVIQLHFHKNMRLKVASQISTVFDNTEYGHTLRKSTPFLEQGSALWTNILKINPILEVFSWSLLEICTTSFPLAFYHWSLAALLGVWSFSYLFIFWTIIFCGSSISHFSFSIKNEWKTERWRENSKVGTEFQTKHNTGNWSETQIRNCSSSPTQKPSKPQSQARAVWQDFLS